MTCFALACAAALAGLILAGWLLGLIGPILFLMGVS